MLLNLSSCYTFVIHLRMTGQLVFYAVPRGGAVVEKNTRVVLYFENGELHFADTRKFGRIQLIDTPGAQQLLKKLGPEPLDTGFDFDTLGIRLAERHKTTSIKAALLDQGVVAGLGNIYADEVLFAAGVRPNKPVQELKASEIVLIYGAIRDILSKSIDLQGTTFRDYRDADGNAGNFQKSLKVYQRSGQTCHVCHTIIKSDKIAGRTSSYCPHCQT